MGSRLDRVFQREDKPDAGFGKHRAQRFVRLPYRDYQLLRRVTDQGQRNPPKRARDRAVGAHLVERWMHLAENRPASHACNCSERRRAPFAEAAGETGTNPNQCYTQTQIRTASLAAYP